MRNNSYTNYNFFVLWVEKLHWRFHYFDEFYYELLQVLEPWEKWYGITVAAQALKFWWGSGGYIFLALIFIAYLGDLRKWSLIVNLKKWWGSSLTGLIVSAAPEYIWEYYILQDKIIIWATWFAKKKNAFRICKVACRRTSLASDRLSIKEDLMN